MPKVSVIVNCYNSEEYLREALESIKGQTYDDYEVIFIDNCSTDNSAAIAKKFGDKLNYFKTTETISLGAGRNYAIERCTGEYIAFLDCDDLWEKDKLATQVKVMDENPNCSITMSNIYMLNMDYGTKTVAIGKDVKNILNLQEFAIDYEFGMSSFIVRKDTVMRMPFKFDERLSYAEEYDFFMRLACMGEIRYTPDVLSTYRVHKNMNSKKLKETIPGEYDIVRINLINSCKSVEKKFPELISYLLFLRDYTKTKICMENKKNSEAREYIKPYIGKYKKAKAFYVFSFLPTFITQWLYKKYYSHKVV